MPPDRPEFDRLVADLRAAAGARAAERRRAACAAADAMMAKALRACREGRLTPVEGAGLQALHLRLDDALDA